MAATDQSSIIIWASAGNFRYDALLVKSGKWTIVRLCLLKQGGWSQHGTSNNLAPSILEKAHYVCRWNELLYTNQADNINWGDWSNGQVSRLHYLANTRSWEKMFAPITAQYIQQTRKQRLQLPNLRNKACTSIIAGFPACL